MSSLSTPSTSSGNSSTANTLASVFAGALTGYVDSQNTQPVYVAQPTPATAYGTAGVAQVTPGTTVSTLLSNPLLIVGVLAVVAVLLLRK